MPINGLERLKMTYKIIQTNDGYMVENVHTGDYLHDSNGDNLFNSYDYALTLLETSESMTEWEQL
jgi:hypothetical protein